MRSVASDEGLRDRLVKLGLEIARSLTWDRCAQATADVYREVLEDAC
jgi:glycosyltransferase involved in cell wall biosynthesis